MTKLICAIALALMLPMTALAQETQAAPQPSIPELGGMAGAGPAIAAGAALILIVAVAASDDDDDDDTPGTSGTN